MNGVTNKPNPKQFNMEEKEGGYLFHLRNAIDLLVRWYSEKQLQVQLWRNANNLGMLPPDTGNLYTSTFRDRLTRDAQEVLFGKKEKGRAKLVRELAEDLGAVAVLLSAPTSSGKTLHEELETSGSSVAEKLVLYARKAAAFFHTPEREAFAAVKIAGHTEHYSVRSKDFRLWLRREFWANEKKKVEAAAENTQGVLFEGRLKLPEAVREQVLGDAIQLLESLALFEGHEEPIYRRIASHDGKVYVDLCDPDWRAVEISSTGWQVIAGDEAPVKFARKPGMLPLPEPLEGGTLHPLRDLLHIGGSSAGPSEAEGERNWRLIATWLVHALTPYGPYTVLTLLGNQGSAKSTTQRVLRNLIDPNVAPLRRKPREDRDLYIAAVNGWVISLDNMSGVPEWLSDALCNLASGGALAVRKNYTDSEEVLLDAMRPIAINGIGDVVTRPDLLDRALIVRLPDFEDDQGGGSSERLDEEALYAKVSEIAPGVFGGLLSMVSAYLANVGKVPRGGHPRMADFSRCGVAIEQELGGEPGSFVEAYMESRGEASATALEAWPVASEVMDYAKGYDRKEPWTGRASELLADLNNRVDDNIRHATDWPSQANQLTAQLNRLAPDLSRAGVHVEHYTEHGNRKMLRIFSEEG